MKVHALYINILQSQMYDSSFNMKKTYRFVKIIIKYYLLRNIWKLKQVQLVIDTFENIKVCD